MPPHCDSLDGPVVVAARRALAERDVRLILPFVHEPGEREVIDAFDRVLAARGASVAADELLDRWFFETVVRVHRAGEGAPYTGLKPAGLSVGPVIPVAERAIETGDAGPLTELLVATLREEVAHRMARVEDSRHYDPADVPAARAYVQANLGLQVWSHGIHGALRAGPHGEAPETSGPAPAHRHEHEREVATVR